MVTYSKPSDRMLELLAGEAVGDLAASERAELLARLGTVTAHRDELMEAAGLTQLACLKADHDAAARMPGGLESRLKEQAQAWVSARSATASSPISSIDDARRRRAASAPPPLEGPPQQSFGGRAGWYAAAALAIALLLVINRQVSLPSSPPLAEQRAELLQVAADVITVPWARSDQPGYEQVTGDVAWSGERQQGYLRLAGLPVNDRAREQYQLWIVDPDRDVRPVDGGVFDIRTGGESLIAIDAKLAVAKPTVFAITLEQPGGVVVSDGPLLVVASLN
jgi:anti-sigma-K factor RskA